nr:MULTISPECIES: MmcQ/YjbR family DNA-binding protein [unclassified Mycolicibacterium]
MSLPETTEKERWGHPTFDVARKMFITVPGDETSFAVRCPRFDREELIAAEPHKFWVPPHEAPSAWVRVRLDALEDVRELTDILTDSWRQAAPSRLTEPEKSAEQP